MKKSITIIPTGGLCNRLRAIGSALTLAQYFDANLIVIWTADEGIKCSFHDLFLPLEGVKILSSYVRSDKDVYIDQLPQISAELKSQKDYLDLAEFDQDFISSFSNKYHRVIQESQNIVIESCYIIDNKCDFSIFRPIKSIQTVVESMHFNARANIGMHIRYTDNLPGVDRSPLYLFEKKLRELVKVCDQQNRIILCTDDASVQNTLCNQFSEYITIPNRQHPTVVRNDKNAMQDAVAELFLLSRMRKIYGTYWSTFGYTAACIGNNQYDVLVNDKNMKHLDISGSKPPSILDT